MQALHQSPPQATRARAPTAPLSQRPQSRIRQRTGATCPSGRNGRPPATAPPQRPTPKAHAQWTHVHFCRGGGSLHACQDCFGCAPIVRAHRSSACAGPPLRPMATPKVTWPTLPAVQAQRHSMTHIPLGPGCGQGVSHPPRCHVYYVTLYHSGSTGLRGPADVRQHLALPLPKHVYSVPAA